MCDYVKKKCMTNAGILKQNIYNISFTYDVSFNLNNNMEKRDLENIYDYRAKGAMLRSKARYVEDGEKNSSYFLNLEKRNYMKKCIHELKNY